MRSMDTNTTGISYTGHVNISIKDILHDFNRASYIEQLPSIILILLLALVGTIGNSLSLFVFVRRMRSSFMNALFILLSGASLLACGVCLPTDVYDMFYIYVYPSVLFCKINKYLNLAALICLNVTLLILAISRMRAVTSSKSSVSLKSRRVTRCCIVGVTLVASLWGFLIYGIKHVELKVTKDSEGRSILATSVIGRDCTVATEVEDTIWPAIYSATMIAAFLLLLITTIVSYYRIWRNVVKSRLTVAAHDSQVRLAAVKSTRSTSFSSYTGSNTRADTSAPSEATKMKGKTAPSTLLDDDRPHKDETLVLNSEEEFRKTKIKSGANCKTVQISCNCSVPNRSSSPQQVESTQPAEQPQPNDAEILKDSKYPRGSKISEKSSRRTRAESTVSRTAFLLTVVFIASYVPFFTVQILVTLNEDIFYGQSAAVQNIVSISVRSFFLTPAVNPLIFWAADQVFRRKMRAILRQE